MSRRRHECFARHTICGLRRNAVLAHSAHPKVDGHAPAPQLKPAPPEDITRMDEGACPLWRAVDAPGRSCGTIARASHLPRLRSLLDSLVHRNVM